MGTSHELVLAEPDQGSSSRRPSALNTSAAMQAPEGYEYVEPGVELFNRQLT